MLILLLGMALLFKTRQAPIGDFANYYYASELLLEGKFSKAVYEPYLFNLEVRQRAPEALYVNYTPVPPVSALFYLPLAAVGDIHQAKRIFNLLTFALFLIACHRLLPRLAPERESWLLLAPALLYTPLLNNFFQGQSYLLALALIMEGFRQWQQKRKVAAGLLWSVPIALKLFPLILLLFLIVQKDGKSFLWTVAFSLLFALSPALFLPWEIVAGYFTDIAPRLFRGEINDPFAILYQSARVLINKAFVPDAHLNPAPLAHLPGLAHALHLFYQFAVLSMSALIMMKEKMPPFARLSLALLAGLLLTGYGSSYSMLLLFLPFLAFSSWFVRRKLRLGAALLLALAANVPAYRLQEWPLLWQFPRLYALLAVLALLAWAQRPRLRWEVLLLAALLMLGKGWLSRPPFPTEGDYYLADGRHGIIYHFEVKGGKLALDHFRGEGAQRTLLPLMDSIWQDPELQLIDNQIHFRGRQLAFGRSRKRQAWRLNENEVLYLSDEGRGAGFYTLRKIRLP